MDLLKGVTLFSRLAFRKGALAVGAAFVFSNAAAGETLLGTGAPAEANSRYYFSFKGSSASDGQAVESQSYLSLSETIPGLLKAPPDDSREDSSLASFGMGREFVFNSGLVVDSGLSYRIGEGFGAGIELAYRKDDFNKFSLGGYGLSVAADMNAGASTVKLRANGFYDLASGGKLKPFLGAGIGAANTHLDRNGRFTEASDKVLAYKFSTGFGLSLNNQLSLKGEYEFFTNADKEYNAMGGEYSGHSASLGLSFDF